MSNQNEQREQEARDKWGDTDAYRESTRRTRNYDDAAKARIATELQAIEADFGEALRAGVPSDDPLARGIAERARLHINSWYYPCPPAMHVALAEMYTADDRFRAHYDDRIEGLAAYVADAIRANAEHAAD